MTLRIPIKEIYLEKKTKTGYEIVIFENNLNTFLGTFISIKVDAKCNGITPVIVLYRFHEDLNIFEKKQVGETNKSLL